MPGAIYNPQFNPMQSFMQQTGKTQADYQDSYNRGYDWTGDMSTGGWTKRAGATQVAPGDPGALGGGSQTPYGIGPSGGGASGGSSTTSLATGGKVGAGGYDATAQINSTRNEFDRILKRGLAQQSENQNLRGAYSGGVGAHEADDYTQQVGGQQSAAIERIMNDVLGRNQSYELAKSQAEWQKQLALMGGGSQRFSSGDTGGDQNQQMMEAFQQIMQGQGGGQGQGGQQGGGGQMPGAAGGGVQKVDQMSPQAESQRRRDASSDFYREHGRWPEPDELQMYLDGVSVS